MAAELREGRPSYGEYDRCAGVVFDMVARQTGERSPDERLVHDWHVRSFHLLLARQQDDTSLGILPAQAAAAHAALWGAAD